MKIRTAIRPKLAGTTLMAALIVSGLNLPASADGLPQALAAAQQAYAAAWAQAPLSFATVAFTRGPAAGYGQYDPRENATFTPGEAINVYAEPVGYGYASKDGENTIDLVAGFELRNTSGQVLAQRDDFARLTQDSRRKVREFPAALDFKFEGLQAGDYVLVTRITDENSGKAGSFSLPFSIAAQ